MRTAGVEPASAEHESENARRTTIVYMRVLEADGATQLSTEVCIRKIENYYYIAQSADIPHLRRIAILSQQVKELLPLLPERLGSAAGG